MISLFKNKKYLDINLKTYGVYEYKTYIEVMGSTYISGLRLAKDGYEGNIILNDSDGELIDLWNTVVKSPIDICYEITNLYTKLKRAKTNNYRQQILEDTLSTKDAIKKAAVEYIYRHISQDDIIKLDFNLPLNLDLELLMLHNIFERHKIRLSNLDYLDIIENNNNEYTFLYIEPPFKIRKMNNDYIIDDKNFNHEQLMTKILDFKGRVVLQYPYCNYIKTLYNNNAFKTTILENRIIIVKE